MRKLLHISFVVLLVLSVLAGCRRADEPMPPVQPEQVTDGQVQVSLTLSLHGFGSDGVLTKADYQDISSVLEYPYEKAVKDYGIFVFDATGAFTVGSSSLYEFNPSAAEQIFAGKADILHVEDLGNNLTRCEFKVDAKYKSLAVLVLANMGDAAYSAAGVPGKDASMQAVMDFFNDDARGINYNTDQSKYTGGTVALSKHGWKVFGSWEGLPSSASDTEKANRELKYYRGMSTPLTVKGFNTATELANYAGTTGAVRESDRLALGNALARLHVRYEPKAGQPAATPAAGVASVEITSVKLHNYKKKVRLLPSGFISSGSHSPFDTVTPLGDLQGTSDADIEFVHPSATDKSWVAYVPELKVSGTDNDPYLIVEMRMTDKDGNVTDFVFERDKIVRTKGSDTVTYEKSPWTEWLQMKTYYSRKMPDGTTDVTIGTYFNLIRNYAYEWIAEGVEGMEL